jgi:hypothetical protein
LRHITITVAAFSAIFITPLTSPGQVSGNTAANHVQTAPPVGEPPIQSGVYGFSGGKVPGADYPEGVIGECIWIFDQLNKKQIAKGECTERSPGKFRVVLQPGRYVVHGPGGNEPIEIKAGQWIKIESVTLLPAGP